MLVDAYCGNSSPLYMCVAFDVTRFCVEHDQGNQSLMSNAFKTTLYLTFEKDDVKHINQSS
jgi:hypothetical protein